MSCRVYSHQIHTMKNLSISSILILVSAICFSQAAHKSVHQEQSEAYSKYNFTSEKEWDALRVAENGKSPELNHSALKVQRFEMSENEILAG